MANKIYTVVKDGTELKELKTLAAAKKLADAEGAEVYADGVCVYSPASDPDSVVTSAEGNAENVLEQEVKVEPDKYTLLHKMNVREKPSLKAKVLGVLETGTVIEATLEDDWLHLSNGTFVLYGGGRFARKE